jgi:hypothetical protein
VLGSGSGLLEKSDTDQDKSRPDPQHLFLPVLARILK